MAAARSVTLEQRVRKARKVASDAIEHAKVINANPELARATRSRAAYKYQAEALERVLGILVGRWE